MSLVSFGLSGCLLAERATLSLILPSLALKAGVRPLELPSNHNASLPNRSSGSNFNRIALLNRLGLRIFISFKTKQQENYPLHDIAILWNSCRGYHLQQEWMQRLVGMNFGIIRCPTRHNQRNIERAKYNLDERPTSTTEMTSRMRRQISYKEKNLICTRQDLRRV